MELYRTIKAPCTGCEDRVLGCHSKCVRYNEWKNKRNEESATIRQRASEEYALCEFRVNELQKIKHGVGRRKRRKAVKIDEVKGYGR